MKKAIFTFIATSLLSVGFSQSNAVDSLYFGQIPPGNTSVIFAPGVISKAVSYEHDITFSPDGKEMFYSTSEANWSNFTIFTSKWLNGSWTTPVKADFSNQYKNTEIIFSPDGQNLYFASSRPPASLDWNFGIFKVSRTGAGWSSPTEIGIKALQPSGNDGNWHPGISNDSTVYFSSYLSGNYDIYCSKMVNGKYAGFENLGNTINSTSNDWYPWISPDNNYLIFSSNRPGGYGGSDLYISFKNIGGTWTTPVNLGSTINTSKNESSPRVTVDKKHFFFTRMSESDWDGDFYWVSAVFLEGLKTTSINQAIVNIQVYPNPTKDKIILSFGSLQYRLAIVEITDLSGKLISSETFHNSSTAAIDLTGNPKGIYILTLSVDDKKLNKKIIIE